MAQNISRLRWLLFFITILNSTLVFADDWRPSSRPRPGVGAECHSQLWSWRLLSERNHNKRADLLAQFTQKCTTRLQSDQPQGRQAEKQQLKLPAGDWPAQPFSFQDRQGETRNGWSLMQNSPERRPAVVVACDFDCDPRRSSWLKRVIMHLYEEGPFHVIIALSPESQPVKGQWLAGGLAYGQAIYEIGFWLQTAAPIRQKISSLQLLGEGWGAQGTLFALLYNQHNPIASDRKVFQGHLALCPAVNLDSALRNIEQPQNEAQQSFAELVRLNLLTLQQRAPTWGPWLLGWGWQEPLREAWLRASVEQGRNWHWLNPFRLHPPGDERAWLQANDIAYQGLGVDLPSWLLGSRQDPRFPWSEHGARLAAQNSDPRKSNLRSQVLEDDSSCAFGVSLGWDVEGALWRALLMSESHEIWPRQSQESLAWHLPTPVLATHEQHLEQEWLVSESGTVQLRYIIGGTERQREVLQNIDVSPWPPELRPNAGAANRWSRLLNVRLRLANNGTALLNNRLAANQLLWWRW
ncbi:MAG: hypothetical protein AB7N80_02545 [Bdellovibrionales bacterium]